MRAWFTQQIHVSWHIAWTALGVVISTVLAPGLPFDVFTLAMLPVAASLLLVAGLRRWRLLVPVALIAGLLLGGWRGSLEQKALQAYQPYYGQTAEVSGMVAEDPSLSVRGDQRLRLKRVHIAKRPMPGQLWLSASSRKEVKRGDIVHATGQVSEGFGSLAAAIFRAQLTRIEHPQPGDVARRVRDWFNDGVRMAVPEPQAALGIGYLTGQRSTLPASLDEQLQIVGLTHAVVASGYNLTILVVFARRLFAATSKYLSALSAGAMIIGFMLITGFSPSMSRAGLVAGLGLIAWYYGRKLHPLVLLPFAAAVTVLVNPAYVWGDIGWYLSFAAFAGVLVLAPLLQRYFWGREPPPSLAQLLVETVAASLTTLPIILYVFGQFPIYALVANMLVLPVVPLAMLLTFAAGAGGLLLPQLAMWAGLPAYWILGYMTWIVEQLANLPGAQAAVQFTLPCTAASYMILSVLSVYIRRRTRFTFRADGHEN